MPAMWREEWRDCHEEVHPVVPGYHDNLQSVLQSILPLLVLPAQCAEYRHVPSLVLVLLFVEYRQGSSSKLSRRHSRCSTSYDSSSSSRLSSPAYTLNKLIYCRTHDTKHSSKYFRRINHGGEISFHC